MKLSDMVKVELNEAGLRRLQAMDSDAAVTSCTSPYKVRCRLHRLFVAFGDRIADFVVSGIEVVEQAEQEEPLDRTELEDPMECGRPLCPENLGGTRCKLECWYQPGYVMFYCAKRSWRMPLNAWEPVNT